MPGGGTKLERKQAEVKKMLASSKQQQKIAKKEKASVAKKGRGKAVTEQEQPQGNLHKKLRAMVTSEEAGPKPTVVEPPFSYEVHARRQTITVDVILYKIPPQLIEVDETTDRKLVVDTTKFSKKYRLEWPFPSKMSVDAKAADYTIENGVLKCVFKVKHMPNDVQQATEKIIESVKEGRKMRFRVDQNGKLAVRSRKATITVPKDEKKSDAASRKRGRVDDGEQKEKETSTKKQPKTTKAGEQKSGKTASNPADESDKKNKKGFVDDDAALDIARAVSKDAAKTQRKKVQEQKHQAKTVETRVDKRGERKGRKEEAMNTSFQTLLEAKRKILADRAALTAAPAKSRAPNPKSVQFS